MSNVFNPVGVYPSDSDDFTPPNFGGPVGARYATITTSGTAVQNLFKLPPGAVPVSFLVNVPASVVGTDAGLNLGSSSVGTLYASKIAVGTLNQQITTGFRAAGLFDTPLANETQVTAQVVGTNIAGGTLDIGCLYILRSS